jgi:hypothetical protein
MLKNRRKRKEIADDIHTSMSKNKVKFKSQNWKELHPYTIFNKILS